MDSLNIILLWILGKKFDVKKGDFMTELENLKEQWQAIMSCIDLRYFV